MRLMNIALLLAATSLYTLPVYANPAPHSQGQLGMENIPSAKLREKMEKLPPQARQRVLDALQRFAIPVEDYDALGVDKEGDIFYIDNHPSDDGSHAPASDPAEGAQFQGITAQDAFTLHSKPFSPNKIFIDVDGHVITGTAWNSTHDTLYAIAYDTDNNVGSFSQSELEDIAAIWHRVAEDFAGFDVDVTTEEPVEFNSQTGRILITSSVDANGNPLPAAGAGGVAYLGVWGRSNYATYYSPALVYYNNLGSVHSIAEASTHEIGHNFGLGHDGVTNVTTYYRGHGSGFTDWGPIMGVGYSAHVTQWSRGEYEGANNQQDDIAIIANNVGFHVDDHGNDTASATVLVNDSDGSVNATNPETDPYNQFFENKGVIEQREDRDFFLINAGSGSLSLRINPAWEAYNRTNLYRGANLDILATLYNSNGDVIAISDVVGDTYADISTEVSAGTYYLAIEGIGTGDPVTGYNDYASLGQYFIRGSLTPASTNNTDPVAINDVATVDANSQISIAVLGNDSDQDGDTLSITSVTQPANGTAVINGDVVVYSPNQDFSGSDNFDYSITDGNGASATASVSITVSSIVDAPLAVNDSATLNEDTQITLDVLSNDSDPNAEVISLVSITAPSNGSAVIVGDSVNYTPSADYAGSDSFNYTITNASGVTASATVNMTVQAVNDAPIAINDSATVDADSLVSIPVLSNDQDIDGDTLSIVSSTQGSNGSTTVSGNTITYTPAAGFVGNDSFVYEVSDGAGGTASAQVTVQVNEVVGPPEVPSGLSVSDNANGSASLSWQDTSNEDNYELQRERWKDKGKTGWLGTTSLSAAQDVTTLTDTSGGGLYRYRIRAINSSGSSVWSSWIEQTITGGKTKGGGRKR